MNTILQKISQTIERYNSGEYITKEKLLVLNRELSVNIYYLTGFNIKAFEKWNAIIYNSSLSVAKATSEANAQVPELRMTRKILDACRGVSIAINNELSIIKND
jgi:hypothetical protein